MLKHKKQSFALNLHPLLKPKINIIYRQKAIRVKIIEWQHGDSKKCEQHSEEWEHFVISLCVEKRRFANLAQSGIKYLSKQTKLCLISWTSDLVNIN